jgi:ABC-type lipoprotein export system ATPase subunit
MRRKHIGFIFQHFNLLSALTALENVEVSLNLREKSRASGQNFIGAGWIRR